MERRQWTQELRKKNLEAVATLMQDYGGYTHILMEDQMPDFEKFVSLQIGCSLNAAKDYIETLRGAALFYKKSKETVT